MAVKIRMTRMGRRHRPFFRINAVESRNPRDGRILEKLGHYDPLEKDKAKQIVLNIERIKYWLDNGAIPSDTISEMLLRQGIKTKYAQEKAARRAKAWGCSRGGCSAGGVGRACGCAISTLQAGSSLTISVPRRRCARPERSASRFAGRRSTRPPVPYCWRR